MIIVNRNWKYLLNVKLVAMLKKRPWTRHFNFLPTVVLQSSIIIMKDSYTYIVNGEGMVWKPVRITITRLIIYVGQRFCK